MRVAVRRGGRRWIARAALLLGALTATAGAAAAVRVGPDGGVLKVRLGGDAHRTRVVVELDRETAGKVASGADPAREVVLSLAHAAAPDGMAGEGTGLVRRWSVSDGLGGARLSLELAQPGVVTRRFLLPPADGVDVYRYVLDVESRGDPTPAAPEEAAAAVRPRARPDPVTLADAPADGPKVVVIDAGHGGKDPGSRGSGVREKDVTLAAAKALRDALKRTGRYKVVLTRDTDAFVPLEGRVRIARRANADLFLSLHADTGTEPGLHGVSTYTLSDQGGRRVTKGVFGRDPYFIDVHLPGGDPTVKQILLDLTQRETRNQSAAFADLLLDRVGRGSPLLHRGHRDAGYVVLFAPDVPAVLMEMGFLTNAEDAQGLADADHRRRMMGEVAQSIDDYFAAGARRYAAR